MGILAEEASFGIVSLSGLERLSYTAGAAII